MPYCKPPINRISDLPSVIMINGQSNAVSPPARPYGFSPLTQFLDSDLLGFSETSQTFVNLVDGGASSKSTLGPGGGILGTILGRRIADRTGRTIRIYALAYTSQGIDYFLPTSPTLAFFEDNTQHGSLNNYNLLKSYVTTSGVIPQLYVWCQGEANAGIDQTTYYNKLKTIFDQTRIDYPNIKWLIVGTIGNSQDRIGAGGAPITGVRLAQKQLADENPGIVYFLDNTDMSSSKAHWSPDGTHYTVYAGSWEVGERAFATLNGEVRPNVTIAPHISESFSWTEIFTYLRSIVSGNVTQWQSDVPPNTTVMVPHTNAPAHVAFDANFAYRSTIDFDRTNAETLKKTGLTAANNWTMFAVAKSDVISVGGGFLMTVQDVPSANRSSFVHAGQSNKLQYFYDASGSDFDNSATSFIADTISVHSYCFVVDTTNLIVKLYVDGELFGIDDISGSEQNMTEIWCASILGTSVFDGQVAAFAYARNQIPTDAQVADMHAWARAEFNLKS